MKQHDDREGWEWFETHFWLSHMISHSDMTSKKRLSLGGIDESISIYMNEGV